VILVKRLKLICEEICACTMLDKAALAFSCSASVQSKSSVEVMLIERALELPHRRVQNDDEV
jgi:hypothetical protein